ncbi:hypothetical protein LZZ85_12425 [Terrimonas sp. NA20]|uniref:Uncharacterized protein n=1 Tax=Terrimonas ginsenosidimutans TaxID=2908004 RepID=A0ABS9KS00_9BACT|nr:hypothetical protein [Terrimonas ginsenosidimutans]MCG2615096.1 hypothetical protein [Terrimonas ginsenosidimutans]
MNTNTIPTLVHRRSIPGSRFYSINDLKLWIRKNTAAWEYNRIGIASTGIFLNVTFAAVMIILAGASGGAPVIFGTGIFFAFFANALILAQVKMHWIFAVLAISFLVNVSIAIYLTTLL